MSASQEMLTSQKFAERAGVSPSTVSKWLKSGKVKGVKQSGKWMISADQLTAVASAQFVAPSAPPVASKAIPTSANTSKPASAQRTYSIEEFSAMTYLTAYGVERFLKEGRLTGRKDEAGKWSVDHANMERSDIQHLIRK